MPINYFSDNGVKVPAFHRLIIRQWIREVIQSYGQELDEISYNFTNDEGILEVNRQYLNHDYYTDIITFDNRDRAEEPIAGDIVISLDTVRSNAEKFGTPYAEELHRVLIHGVLHLVGLDDHSDQEEKDMRAAEDKALQMLRALLGERNYLR